MTIKGTFYAVGLSIIGKATGRMPKVPDWAADVPQGVRKLIELVDDLKDRTTLFRSRWDTREGVIVCNNDDQTPPASLRRVLCVEANMDLLPIAPSTESKQRAARVARIERGERIRGCNRTQESKAAA
ncbi:hypothetical protein A9R05_21845 [Burkholderia sp. KK1]|nr:hypothetical protein A9R05_21845 [Burkholderia sp. KK1]